MRALAVQFSAFALLFFSTNVVRAQARPASSMQDGGYFAVQLMLGVGGSLSTSSASGSISVLGLNPISASIANVSSSDNLLPSFGAGARYMAGLHRYFALGGQLAALTWQDRAADRASGDRNLLLDLSVVPEGRLPISSTIELYLALPVGISLDFWNGPNIVIAGDGVTVDSSDTAVGYNLSLLFGARFAVTRGFGLFAETGYTLHGFSHAVHAAVPAIAFAADVNLHLTLEQLALHVGAFF